MNTTTDRLSSSYNKTVNKLKDFFSKTEQDTGIQYIFISPLIREKNEFSEFIQKYQLNFAVSASTTMDKISVLATDDRLLRSIDAKELVEIIKNRVENVGEDFDNQLNTIVNKMFNPILDKSNVLKNIQSSRTQASTSLTLRK